MKIRALEFAGSVGQPGQPTPDQLPQIAFSGRSNVGKSSLINTLLRRTRKKIAHVSGRPGKTQTINFFRVNDRFFLVDLPGFGFARVPRKIQDQWRELIENYLETERHLRGVVHIVDARREPTDLDLQMLEYLARLGTPTLLVLTKMDKLGTTARREALDRVVEGLGLDPDQVLPFSAKTGEGREPLLRALDHLLANGAEEVEG